MTKNILILGQNFSGKSTLLRQLSGGRIRRRYYPHTRVLINTGEVKIRGEKYQLIEAPGIYTLIPTSENETITLKLLVESRPEKIILVINEEAPETTTLILIQLAELGIPLLVNYQIHNLSGQEYFFDRHKLTHIFNTAVVVSIPTFEPNTARIRQALGACHQPRWVGSYSRSIEKTLKAFTERFRP